MCLQLFFSKFEKIDRHLHKRVLDRDLLRKENRGWQTQEIGSPWEGMRLTYRHRLQRVRLGLDQR